MWSPPLGSERFLEKVEDLQLQIRSWVGLQFVRHDPSETG